MELIHRGWECPRCGKINAPWKEECSCYKAKLLFDRIEEEESQKNCGSCSGCKEKCTV